jgi:dolichol-phosphate mannosyltransferase
VVIPTFCERANVAPLIERLRAVLEGQRWQAIFVDDNSPDGTAEAIKAVAAVDPRIACIHRVGRRGLAGAVLEGVMSSAAPFVAVIDADLQHDEALLPRMLEILRAGDADLVIGSRYVGGGAAEAGFGRIRRIGSRLAGAAARVALKADIADAVSGFFMVRREVVERVAPQVSTQGFKVLFDIVASQPAPLRIVELPYAFGARRAGASKLDGRVVLEYLGLVTAKLTGGLVPARALLFFLVGSSGLLVHFLVLYGCRAGGLGFGASQAIAAGMAMTSNFLVNNAITYRDRRLRGLGLVIGYFRFCGLCALGFIANLAIAEYVHHLTPWWWLAAAAGAGFGAVWNYVGSSLAVW